MWRLWLLVVSVMLLDSVAAEACPAKSNNVAIVLGIAGGEVVVVRLALREKGVGGVAYGTAWYGDARLQVGAQEPTLIGSLDPAVDGSRELNRLLRLARAEAKKVPGFRAARWVSARDCSRPRACRDIALENEGTVLRVGSRRVSHGVELSDPVGQEFLSVRGVVRYKADKTRIAVVNIGVGNPTWASSLRVCEGRRCRDIVTHHHGEQTDVVVVTSGR